MGQAVGFHKKRGKEKDILPKKEKTNLSFLANLDLESILQGNTSLCQSRSTGHSQLAHDPIPTEPTLALAELPFNRHPVPLQSRDARRECSGTRRMK